MRIPVAMRVGVLVAFAALLGACGDDPPDRMAQVAGVYQISEPDYVEQLVREHADDAVQMDGRSMEERLAEIRAQYERWAADTRFTLQLDPDGTWSSSSYGRFQRALPNFTGSWHVEGSYVVLWATHKRGDGQAHRPKHTPPETWDLEELDLQSGVRLPLEGDKIRWPGWRFQPRTLVLKKVK